MSQSLDRLKYQFIIRSQINLFVKGGHKMDKTTIIVVDDSPFASKQIKDLVEENIDEHEGRRNRIYDNRENEYRRDSGV